jgi:hypothetical protein
VGVSAVGRARSGRPAGVLLGAVLLLAGCEARPNWVQPAAGEVLSGEELLLRMHWLAQSGRLADPAAVLRVMGGRFEPRSRRNEELGQSFVVETSLPTRSGAYYRVPRPASLGPTRDAYSLLVSLDERRLCITPADVVRVLGPYREVGPAPFGTFTLEQPLTSAIYRQSAEGEPSTALVISFGFQRCASALIASQDAAGQPEGPH